MTPAIDVNRLTRDEIVGYQREYGELNEAYLTSWQKSYQSFVNAVQSLQSTASTNALDNYIDLLQDVRKEFSASTQGAASKQKKGRASSTKDS